MDTIDDLPSASDVVVSAILVEFERRVSDGSGAGTYTSTFFRFTTAPAPIQHLGATRFDYPAYGATFAKAQFNRPTIVKDIKSGLATSLTFQDHEDVFKGLALVYDFLDWKVRIWHCGFDSNYNTTWINLKIAGRTEGVTWEVEGERNEAIIGVGKDNTSDLVQGPKEEYTPTCRFKFKSPRCGYVGPELTCIRTLDACDGYGNLPRYGGFPRAPAPNEGISTGGRMLIFPARDQFFPRK